MRRTKLVLQLLAACFALSVPSPSAANSIVDTGTPSGAPLWSFHFGQYFAGEFTIADATLIQTIEGYFDNYNSGFAGTVEIAIHADGGDIPGDILFTAETPAIAAFAPLGWYGVSGLNKPLGPGTYWASFNPKSGLVNGSMPGLAPNPLSNYASRHAETNFEWQDDEALGFASPDVGLRINYEPVPDSTSTLSLFVGVAMLGLVAHRLWT